MKNTLTIWLLMFGMAANASVFKMKADAIDLGAWASERHSDICKKIFNASKDGKLKIRNNRGLVFHEIREQVVAFVSTDPNDPMVGYDTTFYVFASYFNRLQIGKEITRIFYLKDTFEFSNTQLRTLRLFNAEEQIYINTFNTMHGKELNHDSIPFIAARIMGRINLSLYREGQLPQSVVYLNDSLKGQIKPKDLVHNLAVWNKDMKSEPDHLGMLFLQSHSGADLTDVFQDAGIMQRLFFAAGSTGALCGINGVSPAYPAMVNGEYSQVAWGYQKYTLLKTLSQQDRQLLEFLFAYIVRSRTGMDEIGQGKYYDPNRFLYRTRFGM